jgi:DNA-binding LacI/PurR family transcriptional regulator
MYELTQDRIALSAAKRGFNIFLCNTNWERNRELQYLRLLAEKRVDGIILAPTDNEVDSSFSALELGMGGIDEYNQNGRPWILSN